jgi:peptide/nickel transport system permease protein
MKFIARRLVHSFLLLVGLSLLSFVFLQLAPGNFLDESRLNPQISQETVMQIYKQYRMDQPLPARYWYWLKSVARGEWGISFAYDTPVAPLIWARARNTLLLSGSAAAIAWVIALVWGGFSADRKGGLLDHVGTAIASALLVTPDLLLALGFLCVALRTHWFYAGGMVSPAASRETGLAYTKDVLLHLVGPVSILVLGSLPVLLRHTRAAMLDVMDSPYIRAARAHGIGRLRILFRHALPAASVPLISLLGFSIGSLLSASLLVEVVMNWPGLGPLLLEAILARDPYVVIGAVMLSALLLVTGMLLADIATLAIDPRIRTENLV